MAILYSTPKYERSGSGGNVSITIHTELMRCMAYIFFWTLAAFAMLVTHIWVKPIIEAGAPEDTPIEKLGCGPFNRVSTISYPSTEQSATTKTVVIVDDSL